METDNTKTIPNEHAEKIQGDETPLPDGEIRVLPPPIRVHETDPDPTGHTPNPSPEDNLSPAFHEHSSPQMQSPSIQTMAAPTTPSGYDSTRIPTSIFSAKPTNPAEWSVTSNESLFSIHMGNNSFSRDYAILFGKPGDVQDLNGPELQRLNEWTNNNNSKNAIPKSCELTGLPTVMEAEENTIHNEVVNSPTEIKNSTPNHPPMIPSPPRFSDDSGNSGKSFAFPVLVGEGGKGAESLKVVPEQPEQLESQRRDSKETANATTGITRWFSFLVCWPRCC